MEFIPLTFIVINLALPYYMWVIRADGDQMNWSALNKNIERIIDNQGGFNNCPTKELASLLTELCKESAIKRSSQPVPVERAGSDVLFVCEVGENSAVLNFQPLRKMNTDGTNSSNAKFQLEPPGIEIQEANPPVEESVISLREKAITLEQTWEKFDCQSVARLGRGPAFLFNRKSDLTHIDFSSVKGDRQSVPIENCRTKLRTAEKLFDSAANRKELVEKLPRVKGDPEDTEGANYACLDYDTASQWKKIRSKYSQ